MDSERARTYEALDRFIQSQRSLLDNLRGDITRLQTWRASAVTSASSPSSPISPTIVSQASSPPGTPTYETSDEMQDDSDDSDPQTPSKEAFLASLTVRLNQSERPFDVTDLSKARLELPDDIAIGLDWSLFSGSDPKPLQSLAATLSHAYNSRNTPPTKQTSSPTVTQQFIRAGRRALLDPVLRSSQTYIHELSLTLPPSDDESEQKLSPEERKRQREREKLRELKKRKIRGWGGLGLVNTPAIQEAQGRMKQGQLGVFVRRDVEDETAEVDVTMDDNIDSSVVATSNGHPRPVAPEPSIIDNVGGQLSAGKTIAHMQATQRLAERNSKPSTKPAKKEKPKSRLPKVEPETDVNMLSDTESGAGASGNTSTTTKAGRPKSETYKQAWTDEEQHLLEQLLEEIPDGEKNRWQKISRAMNGKRTPRQVASRVQKYFEKLKRFGVN